MARIVIVDDSATIRQMLKDILASAGHDIVGEADTGVKGYLEYVKTKPDIVTMDLGMPTMNGLVAMSKILAPFPEARFVVISAMEERKVILEALQRGARGFILKPFRAEQVIETVASILNQSISNQEFREKVRRYRHASFGEAEPAFEEIRSPYDIEEISGGAMKVVVNQNISRGSVSALAVELHKRCEMNKQGIEVHFGMTDRMEGSALVKLDAVLNELHQHCGGVKAAAENEKLIRQIHDEHKTSGKMAFLALLLEEAKTG